MELNISELPEKIVKPNPKSNKNRVSYDDILAKMGMYVDNGKLHLTNNDRGNKTCDNKTCDNDRLKCSRLKECALQHSPENSYIYNKYFKEPIKEPLIPKTLEEYKQMLLKRIVENKIQQQRIRQIKSTKLIMPTENINITANSTNLNRFFRF